MESKTLVWIGLFVGSTIGAFIPSIWGDNSLFSISSFFFSAMGGIAGIYVGFKISRAM